MVHFQVHFESGLICLATATSPSLYSTLDAFVVHTALPISCFINCQTTAPRPLAYRAQIAATMTATHMEPCAIILISKYAYDIIVLVSKQCISPKWHFFSPDATFFSRWPLFLQNDHFFLYTKWNIPVVSFALTLSVPSDGVWYGTYDPTKFKNQRSTELKVEK